MKLPAKQQNMPPITVADPGWGVPPARAPPLRVQVLSFWHTNFSKQSHLGSWCPPYEVGAPPTGNPGSAAANHVIKVLTQKYRFSTLALITALFLRVASPNCLKLPPILSVGGPFWHPWSAQYILLDFILLVLYICVLCLLFHFSTL